MEEEMKASTEYDKIKIIDWQNKILQFLFHLSLNNNFPKSVFEISQLAKLWQQRQRETSASNL